jgi:hypothetical protein
MYRFTHHKSADRELVKLQRCNILLMAQSPAVLCRLARYLLNIFAFLARFARPPPNFCQITNQEFFS